jgi:hypothetical protein
LKATLQIGAAKHFSNVDGGPSGESCVPRPGSEDPHWFEGTFSEFVSVHVAIRPYGSNIWEKAFVNINKAFVRTRKLVLDVVLSHN